MVPTSAHSGDGMGNLIAALCEISQTMLAQRIMYSEELQATVMEVGCTFVWCKHLKVICNGFSQN